MSLISDTNPEQGNILVSDDGAAILCDFGFSRIRHDMTRTKTMLREGGVGRYLAPELSEGLDTTTRIEKASDIYGMGMTFFALAAHSIPFSGMTDYRAVALAQSGVRPSPRSAAMDLPKKCGDELWDLMGRMWDHTPNRRPDASDVAVSVKSIARHVRSS